ncbi:uncharacterized protein [Ptychodera flava]|uniref:uncharacterized protein n=1 Tax=Ptychodera flava TaxID=63121 RepID=UPI00396A2003
MTMAVSQRRNPQDLVIAASDGHVSRIQSLIAEGYNVNGKGTYTDRNGFSKYKCTALHAASREGHSDVVQVLITHGSDVNSINEAGDTALHAASEKGHVDIAGMLIRHSSDVNAKNHVDGHHYTMQG